MNSIEQKTLPIVYKGEVTVKVVSNDGKIIKTTRIHNNGTNYLFEQLATAVVEGSIQPQNLPRKMALYTEGDVAATYTAVLIQDRYVDPATPTTPANAVFVCTIPKSSISGSGDLYKIKLFSSLVIDLDADTYLLASIEVKPGEISLGSISGGQSLIIEWRMSFVDAKVDVSSQPTT